MEVKVFKALVIASLFWQPAFAQEEQPGAPVPQPPAATVTKPIPLSAVAPSQPEVKFTLKSGKVLGVTGGHLSLDDLRELRKQFRDYDANEALRLHPIRHKIAVFTGVNWTNHHVFEPVNDWAVKNPGLVSAGGTLVSAGAYAGTNVLRPK